MPHHDCVRYGRKALIVLAASGAWTSASMASVWTGATDANWSTPGNWTGAVPNASGDVADITNLNISAGTTININTPVTIGTLKIGDNGTGTDSGYILALTGTGTLTFNNGASNAVLQHQSGAQDNLPAFKLESSLDISTIAAGIAPRLNGAISGTGDFNVITTNNGSIYLTSTGNSYIGNTNINGGTLLAGGDVFGNTGSGTRTVTINNNAILRLNNNINWSAASNRVLATGSGGGRIELNAKTFSLGKAGQLTGTTPLIVYSNLGTGTVNISAGNTGYTGTMSVGTTGAGTTLVNLSAANAIAGSLVIGGAGTVAISGAGTVGGSTLTVNAGGTLNVSAKTGGVYALASGQKLTGAGTVVGAFSVGTGATIAPGSSPGTIVTGSQTWDQGGAYQWELNAPAGAQGTAYDWINSSGLLDVTATPGVKFTLDLTSLTPSNTAGAVSGFDKLSDYDWTIATFTGGITGFDAGKFNISTSNFSNDITGAGGDGVFSISQSGNNLVLHYSAAVVPEPASLGGLVLAGLITAGRRRTRR